MEGTSMAIKTTRNRNNYEQIPFSAAVVCLCDSLGSAVMNNYNTQPTALKSIKYIPIGIPVVGQTQEITRCLVVVKVTEGMIRWKPNLSLSDEVVNTEGLSAF
jgi:hypothetical protein